MRSRTRLLLIPTAALALALTGCSGDSDSDGSASESAGSPAPATSGAASSADEGSSAAGGEFGDTVSQQQLVAMAKKLGCSSTTYKKAQADDALTKAGTIGGIECDVTDPERQYLLIHTKPGASAAVAKVAKTAAKGHLPYLHGDNWLIVGSEKKKGKASFTDGAVEAARTKIGAGTVEHG